MILSFHPIYEGDRNLLVAGRQPGAAEARAIRSADAVILPQGCSRRLYEMVTENRRPAFPNYDARFQYPGKTGQIALFRVTGTRHPPSDIFSDVDDFHARCGRMAAGWSFEFPLVLKYDWGGEGHTVYKLDTAADLQQHVRRAETFENGGTRRFLLQPYIPHRRRALRIVVIGSQLLAYWRVQPAVDRFGVNIAEGALIDHHIEAATRQQALDDVRSFCRRTGINLAGFDILYPEDDREGRGIFLEINYFFGRRGLGGSERYYRLLTAAIDQWLASLGLAVDTGRV